MERTAVKVSVVICTYNPADAVFAECLAQVQAAGAHYTPLDILIIDNNSVPAIEERPYVKTFLSENKNSRVVVELKQGLTPARIRGIKESIGDLLIFVDDDNYIDSGYFKSAAEIYLQHPFIGAFSGQVTLEYEREPAVWTKRYWGMLIYRQLDRDVWSNQHFNSDTMPNGAGLCISRDVAEHYVSLLEQGKRNFILDRSKGSLMSGGDNDIAMCACDIGKGMGLFKALHLRHYIPENRFTLAYLSKLAYGIYFSSAMLLYMRTGRIDKQTVPQRIKHLVAISVMKRKDRIIQRSCKKGLKDAIGLIESGTWAAVTER